MEWIKSADALPEHKKVVYATIDYGNYKSVEIGIYYDHIKKAWMDREWVGRDGKIERASVVRGTVTHWMPYPKSPCILDLDTAED